MVPWLYRAVRAGLARPHHAARAHRTARPYHHGMVVSPPKVAIDVSTDVEPGEEDHCTSTANRRPEDTPDSSRTDDRQSRCGSEGRRLKAPCRRAWHRLGGYPEMAYARTAANKTAAKPHRGPAFCTQPANVFVGSQWPACGIATRRMPATPSGLALSPMTLISAVARSGYPSRRHVREPPSQATAST